MIDLTKLTPAPWIEWYKSDDDPQPCLTHGDERCVLYAPYILKPGESRDQAKVDLAFAALARQAFDVMTRRGWMPTKHGDGQWYASREVRAASNYDGPDTVPVQKGSLYPDPFTALVESDRWYRENVENSTKPGL